jgi:hypothetical protein
LNGQAYVEEYGKKAMGTDEETRIAPNFCLGNQRYENKVQADENSKRTKQERWHKVHDKETVIEGFKVE